MSIVAALILYGSAAGPAVDAPSKPDELVSRMQSCGFRRIVVRYDAELQMGAVLIRDEVASDPSLACAAKVHDEAESGLLVEFEDEQMELRYFEQVKLTFAPRMRETARSWLAERNLLDKLPDYATSGLSDEAFVRRIETICGPASKGVLTPFNGKFAFKPNSNSIVDDPVAIEAFGCLLYSSIWSGFELGFIGNETVRDD